MAQLVKNLPTIQETWVLSLGWEDALEKEMANHSNILAWRFLWVEEPGGLQFLGLQRVGHDRACKHALFKIVLLTQFKPNIIVKI